MSNFKSQFLNIMVERGFYNQCTNEQGFDEYLYECEKAESRRLGIWARTQPATVCTWGILCR